MVTLVPGGAPTSWFGTKIIGMTSTLNGEIGYRLKPKGETLNVSTMNEWSSAVTFTLDVTDQANAMDVYGEPWLEPRASIRFIFHEITNRELYRAVSAIMEIDGPRSLKLPRGMDLKLPALRYQGHRV